MYSILRIASLVKKVKTFTAAVSHDLGDCEACAFLFYKHGCY